MTDSDGPGESAIPYAVERAWGLTIVSADTVSGGFSGASVFRASTSDGRELAIRRIPKSIVLPSARILSLHRLLTEISRTGCLLVPVPLPPKWEDSADDHGIDCESLPWITFDYSLWQVEPWMPGSSLTGDALATEHLKAALTSLDQFHQLAAGAVNEVGHDEWFHKAIKPSPAVVRRLQIVTELIQGELDTLGRRLSNDPDVRFRSLAVRICKLLKSSLPWLHRELSAMASIAVSVQPVLRDVWQAHVLFTGHQVTGLIDLSAAASDHVTLDVVRLTRSYFGADISKIRNAVNDFQELRELNDKELRLMSLLDASAVLLSPVTWLRRRINSSSTERCPDEVIARLTQLVEVAEIL